MDAGTEKTKPTPPSKGCPDCLKPQGLCVCATIQALTSRHRVLILQHPQEPDKLLGSARLANLSLPKSSDLKIGLSWRNLAHALGREGQPARWAVLYLGSGIKTSERPKPGLHFVTKSGTPTPPPQDLEGFIVLDGTWSQAKTLWWRNAWLLKLRRAILVPKHKSLYGELRREPRRECLSTIETIAETLDALQENPEIGQALRRTFAELLNRRRATLKART